jgi:hypothetical protein
LSEARDFLNLANRQWNLPPRPARENRPMKIGADDSYCESTL